MNISELVRILCVKKNTTVSALSEKMGNTKQNLFMKLYRNDMKLSDVEKIAGALGCAVELHFIDKNTKEIIV